MIIPKEREEQSKSSLYDRQDERAYRDLLEYAKKRVGIGEQRRWSKRVRGILIMAVVP